jgi:hypothetical protein
VIGNFKKQRLLLWNKRSDRRSRVARKLAKTLRPLRRQSRSWWRLAMGELYSLETLPRLTSTTCLGAPGDLVLQEQSERLLAVAKQCSDPAIRSELTTLLPIGWSKPNGLVPRPKTPTRFREDPQKKQPRRSRLCSSAAPTRGSLELRFSVRMSRMIPTAFQSHSLKGR